MVRERKKGDTHQPINPYNLCILVKPKNLNAESPSKNCVSGIALVADSRLSHPLFDMIGGGVLEDEGDTYVFETGVLCGLQSVFVVR